ncbi:PAS domain S-box-containing protein [Deinococcus yavapaiensis KR-236]|uniref:histidine kinase n=1 Tax=Deinococcus yavapaiensis KR-236 TaxID=694435 RepID=A0A318SDH9_9DEIO|nr:PAS domain S-box-containing protein [Deinococcus yavapaiensis KR-236]
MIQSSDEFHLPFRVVRKDGSVRRVEDDGYFMRADDGRVTRMVGFVKDVTERGRILAALKRSNEELERSASVASHDLQAPIRAVTSFAEVVARRYGEVLDDRGRTYLRQIVENGEHMKRLIDGLMTYSRMSLEQQPLLSTDASAVFDAVVRRLQPEIDTFGATVVRGALPTVLADAQQLDQLLQTLVSNALKYHRAGVAPMVRVEAERDETCWRFSVSDNGLGIEPVYFEKIFGMFQRLHGRGEFEGTGIGLSVCKHIVERHGGRLWVESELGQGSRFHFTLQDA